MWGRSLGLILVTYLPLLVDTTTTDTTSIGPSSSTRTKAALLIHVAAALLILGSTWAASVRVRPCASAPAPATFFSWLTLRRPPPRPDVYKFQNALDKSLQWSAMLLLLLGTISAFAIERDSQDEFVLTVLMLCMMLGAIALAVCYLVWVSQSIVGLRSGR